MDEKRVPINEDEFERLPEYVQDFIKRSQNGELEQVSPDDLKEALNRYFISQEAKVQEIKDDEHATSITKSN
jgi:hypothetical protein